MKINKILLVLLLITSTQIFAQENKFDGCKENILSDRTKIFLCENEKLLVKYTSDNCNVIEKLILINGTKSTVLIDDTNK